MSQNILFIWDGFSNNMIDVCVSSLRKWNSNCKIYFYYDKDEIKNRYQKYNIEFRKLDLQKWSNRRMLHKIELAYELNQELNINDQLLVLDCDLLFQGDPFSMYKEFPNQDYYFATSVMSKKKNTKYAVNGGVWGVRVSDNTRKFLLFWVTNIINPEWNAWKKFGIRKKHISEGFNWWVDQDFMNCVNLNSLPFELRKKNVGHAYNYYTDKSSFFKKSLEMNSKIGNSNYKIIHFKGIWKKVYQVMDPKVYNLKNFEKKKILYNQDGINYINQLLGRIPKKNAKKNTKKIKQRIKQKIKKNRERKMIWLKRIINKKNRKVNI